jgi:glycosyltransferase involved in cell wall biosynthesis
MSRLAQENRVLFFEPGRNPDKRHSVEMWRNWPNFLALRPQPVHENLVLIPTPSCLPVMRRHLPGLVLRFTTPWVTRVNSGILIRHVHRTINAFRVEAPILWLYSPYHFDLVGQFGEKLACYYNYDEFPDFVHNRRISGLLRQYDNRLSSQVNVVFATSRSQWKRRRAVNPHTHFVPNGVDFELFSRALAPDLPLPADISAVPRPIIGYAGWLGYQVDAELLSRVAEAYPHCSLVLVGPDELSDVASRQRLLACSNVFFLGAKKREELPNYLQAFDAALIPYALEGHALSIYPLKLHEYLAAGRAVVATAMPELQPFSQVVRIADSPDDFVLQIGKALDDQAPQAVAARVAVARQNTWEHRVSEISRCLRQHLTGTSLTA